MNLLPDFLRLETDKTIRLYLISFSFTLRLNASISHGHDSRSHLVCFPCSDFLDTLADETGISPSTILQRRYLRLCPCGFADAVSTLKTRGCGVVVYPLTVARSLFFTGSKLRLIA